MKDENKDLKTKFTEWLETLQQESWQLEMIISGLSIALVSGIYEQVCDLNQSSQIWYTASQSANALRNITLIIFIGWHFLFINLCLHLLLRGLWISTLGLRYVSGDIDYDSLNYSERFTKHLKNRIGSFDDYIENLEKLCSIIFAFTFLILFSLLSFAFYMSFIVFTATFLEKILGIFLSDIWTESIVDFIMFSLLILGAFYLIDFITLGFFKKRKRFFAWYFWVYRFMSIVSLAWIYRPIYHNFTDNKFSRYFAFLLIPYIIVTITAITSYIKTHKYYPENGEENFSISEYDYADESPDDTTFRAPKISSKFVKNGFLEIFLPYNPDDDDEILKHRCPDFTPKKETGLSNWGVFDVSFTDTNDTLETEYGKKYEGKEAEKSLLCLQKIWRIYLGDSLIQHPTFFLFENKKAYGLKVVLDIADQARGQHDLYLEKQYFDKSEKDSTLWEKLEYIPFWKE